VKFDKSTLCVTYHPEVVGLRDLIQITIEAGNSEATFVKTES
jgi:hypothetical protein